MYSLSNCWRSVLLRAILWIFFARFTERHRIQANGIERNDFSTLNSLFCQVSPIDSTRAA